MFWQVQEPKLIRQIFNSQLDSLLVLLVHLHDLDKKINVGSLILGGDFGKSCVRGDMDSHVVSKVVDGPLSQSLDDAFVHTHIERVVFARKLVRVIVALTWGLLSIFALLVDHLGVTLRVVALEGVLGVCLEQGPAGIELDIDMELLAALIVFDIGAVHSYDVSNLAHNWTLLKTACVDDDD